MSHPKKAKRTHDLHAQIPNKLPDIKHVTPLTKNQKLTFEEYDKGKNLFLHGSAGTGKTFISCYLAFNQLLNSQQQKFKKIIIIRSVVQTRDMGFLPGNQKEKYKPFELPYYKICSELFGRGDVYDLMKQKGVVEFTCTSFIRGITLDDAIIIVDEAQNMTAHELNSVITRSGDDSKIIFAGDIRQTDLRSLREQSGIRDFMKIIKRMKEFSMLEFKEADIVRSSLVKNYIITRNMLEDDGQIASL